MPPKIEWTEEKAKAYKKKYKTFPMNYEPEQEPRLTAAQQLEKDARDRLVKQGKLGTATRDSLDANMPMPSPMSINQLYGQKHLSEAEKQDLITPEAGTLFRAGISPSAEYTTTGKKIAEKETRAKEAKAQVKTEKSDREKRIKAYESEKKTLISDIKDTYEEKYSPLFLKRLFRKIEKGADYNKYPEYGYSIEMREILNEPSIKEAITNLMEKYPEAFGKGKTTVNIPEGAERVGTSKSTGKTYYKLPDGTYWEE